MIAAYHTDVPSNLINKKLSSDSGRSIDMDLISPQDGSLRGPNDNYHERLSDNSDNVKELNSIQVFVRLEGIMTYDDR